MTFNHNEAESKALDQLAEEKGMSKTAVMKQALRLYQLVNQRQKEGWTLNLDTDQPTKRKVELVVL